MGNVYDDHVVGQRPAVIRVDDIIQFVYVSLAVLFLKIMFVGLCLII